jgi:hypothetical protein
MLESKLTNLANLANLSKLAGGAPIVNTRATSIGAGSYNICKSDKVSKVMKEFENQKLKDRKGKVINNQKQAIAIALHQVQNSCKYNPSDVKNLVDKVNKDLNEKDKKLNLSNIIETKNAIEQLNKIGKSKRSWMFKKLLWDKIIDSQRSGESLNSNMWEEIKKIHEL